VQERIKNGCYADFQASKDVPTSLHENTAQFISHFGHLSDSGNDFSCVPWREDPDLVMRMIVIWDDIPQDETAGTAGNDPTDKSKIVNWETAPLTSSDKLRMHWQYQRARRFRLYRDAISFKYTYGYGLIRNYVLALAASFVKRGILADQDDIFFLFMPEVRAFVEGEASTDLHALIEARKEEISRVEDIVLPEIIYGDAVPPPEMLDESKRRLSGIPTSGGYYEGHVCVIKSLNEFDKMQAGAVLVIPYSDVSWTPLFAKAGAVIAESGGILSHSSIVAREYLLPAVVSVPAAAHVLKDGMVVTVDGYTGEVLIGEEL
jgi:pyruvate,water dikinase